MHTPNGAHGKLTQPQMPCPKRVLTRPCHFLRVLYAWAHCQASRICTETCMDVKSLPSPLAACRRSTSSSPSHWLPSTSSTSCSALMGSWWAVPCCSGMLAAPATTWRHRDPSRASAYDFWLCASCQSEKHRARSQETIFLK